MILQKPYNYVVQPEPGESLLGYMDRLAVRNLHSYAHWIKRDIGMHPAKRALTEQQAQKLAFMSGQDLKQLATMQSAPAKDNRTTFAGWSISETEIERARSRLCPDCMAGKQIHRQIWNLRIITVCPIHASKLIDACPICREPLLWSRLGLLHCVNGHALNRSAPDKENVSHKELSGIRALYEKCNVPVPGSRELEKLPDVVRKLDLSECIAFLLFVGRAATRDKTAWRAAGAYRYDPDKTHKILSAGFKVAKSWPESFITLIGELHTKSQRKSHQIGLGPDVGRLFRMFANRDSQPFLEIVKDAIRQYVARHQVFLHGRTKRILGYQDEAATEFINSTQAGRILDCSKETARKFAIAHKWASGEVGPGNVLRIDRAKVESWKKNGSTITLMAAGKALGLWRRATFDAFENGLLKCEHGDRKCGHGKYRGRHAIRRSEVDKLVRVVNAPIKNTKHARPELLVSWRSFQLRANGYKMHAGIALRAMIDGKLVVRARDPRRVGFDGLRFDLVDLLHLSASTFGNGRLNGSSKPSASIADSSSITGMHIDSIARGIELKLLKPRASGDQRSTCLIELDDLRKFSNRYATAGSLARENNLHVNVVKRALNRLEINPVGNRDGRKSEYPIYSKRELEQVGFRKIVAALKRSRAATYS